MFLWSRLPRSPPKTAAICKPKTEPPLPRSER
jgi:hypothetical protein